MSGGVKNSIFGMRWVASPTPMSKGVQKSIFDLSRSLAPKLAFVPGSRLYCNEGVCYLNVCGKYHKD